MTYFINIPVMLSRLWVITRRGDDWPPSFALGNNAVSAIKIASLACLNKAPTVPYLMGRGYSIYDLSGDLFCINLFKFLCCWFGGEGRIKVVVYLKERYCSLEGRVQKCMYGLIDRLSIKGGRPHHPSLQHFRCSHVLYLRLSGPQAGDEP